MDHDQALQLYRESMIKGYLPATFNLAMLYLYKAKQTQNQQVISRILLNCAQQYKEAAILFMQIIQKDPESVESFFNLG